MADGFRQLPKSDRGLQTYLSNLRAPGAREWLALGDGLAICLEPNGAKTFQARLRRQGEIHARRIRIGSFPAVSVADARKKLLEMKSVAREGRDPALEQRRAKAGVRGVRTLADLVAEYLGRREGAIAIKTLRLETELLDGVLVPALGDRLLADLAPMDFGSVLFDYAGRLKRAGRSNGTNANKLLAVTRRMFKAARGWGLVELADPTAGLARPAKESPRGRILFDGKLLVGPNSKTNEIGILVAALTADPSPVPASASTRTALMLTLMLGFRALEVSSLEWTAIDLDAKIPTVSITTSKTKAGLRELPLPRATVDFLRSLELSAGRKQKYVFPAEDGARRAAHLHPESLSRAFARACDRLGIEEVTLHDLRRTCLSGLIELGHESVAERIAGHVPRHVMGRHYDRSVRLEAMRTALEAWAGAVGAATTEAIGVPEDRDTLQIHSSEAAAHG
ncbi:MAG: tyrosine-type recombinase/integrase [Methylovirgula sp.]|jgi:integrase